MHLPSSNPLFVGIFLNSQNRISWVLYTMRIHFDTSSRPFTILAFNPCRHASYNKYNIWPFVTKPSPIHSGGLYYYCCLWYSWYDPHCPLQSGTSVGAAAANSFNASLIISMGSLLVKYSPFTRWRKRLLCLCCCCCCWCCCRCCRCCCRSWSPFIGWIVETWQGYIILDGIVDY